MRDADYYHNQYLVAKIANRHFATKNIRKFNDKLQKAADYFDVYYLSQKLKYSCEMMSMQRFLSADYSQNLIDEIGRFLQHSPYLEVPAIALYHQVFLTLTDEDNEAHFEKLMFLIQQNIHKFPESEMQSFFAHALNYCIRKMRQKNEKYVAKALDIYMQGVDNQLLLHNGVLSPWDYKNIVKLGLRLQKFEWTEQFIKGYTDVLATEYRLNAFNYGMADLLFHKQDMRGALIHLREVEFSDIFFTLDAKVMLIKIYYDKQVEEALISLLASFKIFLKRSKLISNEVRQTYGNFITLVHQLWKTQPQQMPSIIERINETSLLTDRNWLLSIASKKQTG